jgi:hypothetical protein
MKRVFVVGIIALCAMLVIRPGISYAQSAKALFYDPGTGSTNPSVSFDTDAQQTGTQTSTSSSASGLPASGLQPGVRYWIELVYPDDAEMHRVNADRVFRSGERIRIHYTPNYDGYLFVMQKGSSGQTSLLFPSQFGTNQNLLRAGQDHAVPAQGWFRFDTTPGLEQLQVVFFPGPGYGDPDLLKNVLNPSVTRVTLENELLRLVTYYTGSGSKDLIAEMDNSFFSANPTVDAAPINEQYPQIGQQVSQETALPPAGYVVNTVPVKIDEGKYAQPVVMKIGLQHQ